MEETPRFHGHDRRIARCVVPQFFKFSDPQSQILLVGGFNPSEEYYSKWECSPNRGENSKKYLSCHHLV